MPITLDDGWRAFAMIGAAYKSVARGKMEKIIYPH
jgi:hypothetical protein